MRPLFKESAITAAKRDDRIRAATPPAINARLDKDTEIRLWWHAAHSRDDLQRRIEEIDQEWPIERYLESKSGLLALTGAVLGSTGGKDVVAVLRRIGVRTQSEIDHERHALGVLQGYFEDVDADASATPGKQLEPVER